MKKLLLLAALAVTLSSCSKKGDTGDTGPAGADGNANVHSYSFTMHPGDWQQSGVVGSTYEKYVDLNISSITQSIIDGGAVLVYWNVNGSLLALPATVPTGGDLMSFLPSCSLGSASLEVFTATHTSFNFNTDVNLKVVVIAGSTRLAHPEIDWQSISYNKALSLE